MVSPREDSSLRRHYGRDSRGKNRAIPAEWFNSRTVKTWVNLSTTTNWTWAFDFGDPTIVHMFPTSQNGITGRLRFVMTTSGAGAEQQVNSSSSALSAAAWDHVTVTLRGTTGTPHLNSVPVKTGKITHHIGRSQYGTFPHRGAMAVVKRLQALQVPIHGLGSQMHANLIWPTPELLDAALANFAELGVSISITELDVDATRRGQGRQSAEISLNGRAGGRGLVEGADQKLAGPYANVFRVLLNHREQINLVTFWGVTDRDSWRRFANPLPLDRERQLKPAFDAVISVTRPIQP